MSEWLVKCLPTAWPNMQRQDDRNKSCHRHAHRCPGDEMLHSSRTQALFFLCPCNSWYRHSRTAAAGPLPQQRLDVLSCAVADTPGSEQSSPAAMPSHMGLLAGLACEAGSQVASYWGQRASRRPRSQPRWSGRCMLLPAVTGGAMGPWVALLLGGIPHAAAGKVVLSDWRCVAPPVTVEDSKAVKVTWAG
jgi:hypothetical protein